MITDDGICPIPANGGLSQLSTGEIFEYIDKNECELMFEEIFGKHIYLKHGISICHGDTIVDVGSNIGLFALYCPTVNSNLNILTIEPIPPIAVVLARNLEHFRDYFTDCSFELETIALTNNADFQYQDFHFFPTFPAESTRNLIERNNQHQALHQYFAKVSNGDSPELGSSCDDLATIELALSHAETVAPITYPCTMSTLEAICMKRSILRIDLLKIDVEGDELKVLLGLGNCWAIVKQIVIEVHDIDNRLHDVCELLRSNNYFVYVEQQISEINDDGYLSLVPADLQLYYVYARRNI